jgi:cell division cycle 20-like protein 1 (cofactor of APC complex)
VLGVGLGSSVYTWSAQTSEVKKLCDLAELDPPDSVTSLSWVQRVSVPSLPPFLHAVGIFRLSHALTLGADTGDSSRDWDQKWDGADLGRPSRSLYSKNDRSYCKR